MNLSCIFRRAQTLPVFFRQFATLIAAGVPIHHAIHTLISSTHHPALHSILTTIQTELHQGRQLSQTLQRFPHLFNSFIIHLIRLGEHTGTLDRILLSLANTLEQQQETRRKIQQALVYPIIIASTSILMLLIMLIFIVPRFAELFAAHISTLPLLTRLIFLTSDALHHHPFLILTTLAILFAGLRRLNLTAPFQQKIILTHFARHLGLCLHAGIPLIDALRLVIQPHEHPDFARHIYQLRHQLNAGQPFHAAMTEHPCFPSIMIQMIKTGEETGTLDDMLDKIADYYERDLTHFIKQFSQLLEPLIMIILGVLIGGLVIGMYLPVFKLGSTL